MCVHPRRAQLEERALDGDPVREIAEELGHSPSAVYRHLRNHVRPEVHQMLRRHAETHVSAFVDRLRALTEEVAAVRVYARETSDPRLLLQAAQVERETLRTLMDRLGIDSTETVEVLAESRVLAQVVGPVLAVSPPEVAEALAARCEAEGNSDMARAFTSLADSARVHARELEATAS